MVSSEGESSSVLFHGVLYLGAASIEDARHEDSVRQIMDDLGSEDSGGLKVTLSIPTCADGLLKLLGKFPFSLSTIQIDFNENIAVLLKKQNHLKSIFSDRCDQTQMCK